MSIPPTRIPHRNDNGQRRRTTSANSRNDGDISIQNSNHLKQSWVSSSFQSSSSRKRRVPPTRKSSSVLQSMAILLLVAMSRLLYSTILVSTHYPITTMRERQHDQPYISSFLRPTSSYKKATSAPSRTGTDRIRRPSQISVSELLEADEVFFDQSTSLIPLFDYENSIQDQVQSYRTIDLPTSTRELCESGNADNEPRVLIYGILQHPAGEEIAQVLYQKCNIHSISGIADHTLSGDILLRLESLMSTIPSFRLHRIQHLHTQASFQTVLRASNPTHIIYLETSTFASDTFREEFHYMYGIRSSLVSVEQLLRAMVLHSQASAVRPIVTYVSTLNNDDRSKPTEATSKIQMQLSARIFPIYQAYYNVNVQHLILPELFGPFHETSSWLNEEFFVKNSNSTISSNKVPIMMHHDKPLLHVQRAVTSTISTALKRSVSVVDRPWIVRKEKSIPFSTLSKSLRQLQSSKNLSNLDKSYDSLIFLLAWYHIRQNPTPKRTKKDVEALGRSTIDALNITRKHLLAQDTNGISLLQRLDNQLFPCTSECSGPLSACNNDSVWNSVGEISRNVTSSCRYVLYLSNFSKKLESLSQLRENQEEGTETYWPKDTLCRVAFVSSESNLVKSAIRRTTQVKDQASNNTNLPSIPGMNGYLQHNGWTLVWTNEKESSLSEADLIFPKIAPRTLFGENVTRALYIEPQHFRSLPSLPIVWFLMNKQLDERAIPKKNLPSRITAFFIHSFSLPESIQESNSFDGTAKYILQQKGLDSDRRWPRRQIEFYEQVTAMSEKLFDFQFVDTALIIHDFRNERSRRLRCEWYREHLAWSEEKGPSSNRDLEDISLAYMLGKWRRDQRLYPDIEDRMGERILDPSRGDSMVSIIDGNALSSKSSPKPLPAEYFLRVHDPLKARKVY